MAVLSKFSLEHFISFATGIPLQSYAGHLTVIRYSLLPLWCRQYSNIFFTCINVSMLKNCQVWRNYTCRVSVSGLCISRGRITPDIYFHLAEAVNVSYALYHYTPLLLSLQDCRFVRETFDTITTNYCPNLEHDLFMVSVGLALISIGVLLCLILWIFYANRPQREEVFAPLSKVKFAPNSNISMRMEVSS